MSMISDLADRLRVESKSMGKYGTDYMATLLMEASDTITMLSEKARADRPKGKWIPCSERLPEDDGYYLVSLGGGDIEVEWYDKTGWGYFDVIAWMPLPEPWKGESDEEGNNDLHG